MRNVTIDPQSNICTYQYIFFHLQHIWFLLTKKDIINLNNYDVFKYSMVFHKDYKIHHVVKIQIINKMVKKIKIQRIYNIDT